MEKLYFENEDAEICHSKKYFDDMMRMENKKEMKVHPAIKDKIGGGIFWCKTECFCGDDSQDTYGKQCANYEPRNGKSGCCKAYTTTLYLHGDKITLTLDSDEDK